MKKTYVKKLVLAAMCVALCVVLPIAVHSVPNAGTVLLPMHIPVLLCGMMCSWPYGLICGLLGPFLSHSFTGMPPISMLPSMMLECAVYGCVAGIMLKLVRTKRAFLDLYIAQITAMVAGRVIAGFAKAWIFTPGISPFAWVTTSLVAGIPGIVLQLVLIPAIVMALSRARLLERRYAR